MPLRSHVRGPSSPAGHIGYLTGAPGSARQGMLASRSRGRSRMSANTHSQAAPRRSARADQGEVPTNGSPLQTKPLRTGARGAPPRARRPGQPCVPRDPSDRAESLRVLRGREGGCRHSRAPARRVRGGSQGRLRALHEGLRQDRPGLQGQAGCARGAGLPGKPRPRPVLDGAPLFPEGTWLGFGG